MPADRVRDMRAELEEAKAAALRQWTAELQRIVGTPAVTALRAVR